MYNQDTPTYDPAAVQPMRDELTCVGVNELLNSQDVESVVKADGTSLVILNSVCGCSGGAVRPGVAMALQSATIPNSIATVFAGMEKAAVRELRNYLPEPATSPNICLFKNGELVHYLDRPAIQGLDAETLAIHLSKVFEENCNNSGPSISVEDFSKLGFKQVCGSTIKRQDGEVGTC